MVNPGREPDRKCPRPYALPHGPGQGVSIGNIIENSEFDDTEIAALLPGNHLHKPGLSRIRIEPYSDGSFSFTLDGTVAHCAAVPGVYGRTEDIVAWLPEHPESWWLHRRIGVVLGMASVESAEFLHEPLRVFDTPADWVAAKSNGACVLVWDASIAFYLPSDGRMICQSERLARKLRRALTPPTPKVEVSHG